MPTDDEIETLQAEAAAKEAAGIADIRAMVETASVDDDRRARALLAAALAVGIPSLLIVLVTIMFSLEKLLDGAIAKVGICGLFVGVFLFWESIRARWHADAAQHLYLALQPAVTLREVRTVVDAFFAAIGSERTGLDGVPPPAA